MSQTPDERFKELLKTIENITYPNLWIVEDFNNKKTATPYTPGPWRVHEDIPSDSYCPLIEAENSEGYSVDIANVSRPAAGGLDNMEANAKLIAAAPELLEALKLCAILINKRVTAGNVSVDFLKIQDLAFSAIAKATGVEQ